MGSSVLCPHKFPPNFCVATISVRLAESWHCSVREQASTSLALSRGQSPLFWQMIGTFVPIIGGPCGIMLDSHGSDRVDVWTRQAAFLVLLC